MIEQAEFTINGSNLRAFKERIQVGDMLRCVENTRIPARTGGMLTVVEKRTNALRGLFSSAVTGETYRGYRVTMPARVGDVIALSRNRITYRVGKGRHYITWERMDVVGYVWEFENHSIDETYTRFGLEPEGGYEAAGIIDSEGNPVLPIVSTDA